MCKRERERREREINLVSGKGGEGKE